MKYVLLVDDDASFLLSLSDGLGGYADQFKVLTASNGSEAIAVLQSQHIDLIITDLKMPVMDGFLLLAHVSRSYPYIRVIVMTAFGTMQIEQKVRELGTSQYLEKPVDLDELTEKIFQELDASERGFIHGFSLPTFLQLVEMEKKSYILKISSKGRMGLLYFVDGNLVEARTDEAEGIEAAIDIVSWEKAGIGIEGCSEKREDRIKKSIAFILIEAARLKDECEEAERESSIQAPEPVNEEDASDEQAEEATEVKDGISIDTTHVEEKLKEFGSLAGFRGVAIVNEHGEPLSVWTSEEIDFSPVGSLITEVMADAHAMAERIGVGGSRLVHIETAEAQIFVINPGLEEEKTGSCKHSGKWRLILVCSSNVSIGMAKVRLLSIAAVIRTSLMECLVGQQV